MHSAVIRQLRVIGLLEGISFLLLMGVAMPLKYLAGMPRAVSIVGMAHGVLFLLYLVAVGHAQITVRWPITRALMLVAAAVLPFGPFLVDGWLKRQQRVVESAGRS